MSDQTDIVHEIFSNGTPVLFGVVIVICVTWLAITVIRTMKQRANARTRAGLYRHMIDKFGTAPEFIAFLQSESGQKFIDENVSEAASPTNKILNSIQIGVVFGLVGLGVLVLGGLFGPREVTNDMFVVMSICGTICATIGFGFLVSAAIAYKLCQTWGLIPQVVKTKAA